jgi:hypothetical protein
MVTIAVYWIAASYVLGIGLTVDQMRRPLSEWQAAGRDRRFWVALTLIAGFHGLGEYVAAAYAIGVVPRFRAAESRGPRLMVQRMGTAIMSGWRRATPEVPAPRRFAAAEELVMVAALLVFASSFIHSVVIADHFEEFWLFGAFFAAVTCVQAAWTVLIYGDPLNRRLLLVGALSNGALVVVWTISRTVGVPVGPQPWRPEAVGVVDVLSTLDELVAVVLVMTVLVVRGSGGWIAPAYRRLAAMAAGPLFLYSTLAAFGGGGHHH